MTHTKISIGFTGELALKDKLPGEARFRRRAPGPDKRTVPARIGSFQKGLHRLTKDLSGDREAKLLKPIPTQMVKIKHGSVLVQRSENVYFYLIGRQSTIFLSPDY